MRLLWLTKSAMLSRSAVFGGGDDADRFVQRDQHQIFFIARFDQSDR